MPFDRYTVQAGDTLYSIANRFGTTVDALVALNGLADPSFIYVGQVLLVPGAEQPTPPSDSLLHVVQAGDTLYSIAWRYGTTVNELARLNNIANPWFIYTGQKLLIPSAGQPEERVYIVQEGDTLTSIALRHDTTVQTLMLLNQIRNPWWIYPGQRLLLPDSQPQPSHVYTVLPGDTLYSIAWRNGTTVEALAAANGIAAPWVIYVGQQLVLP
jgi:LysM repeat protein